MKKILLYSLALIIGSMSVATASEVVGSLDSSNGITAGNGLQVSLACSPASVSNGSVNPTTCAISCNSGYERNDNSCVEVVSTPSKGRGSGSGPGRSIDDDDDTGTGTKPIIPKNPLGFVRTNMSINSTIENGHCYVRGATSGVYDSSIIDVDSEFLDALTFMYSYELTRFNNVDEFLPYSSLTRAQAAKLFSQYAINVLCRQPDLSITANYSDLQNADTTLTPYITLALQLGLMKGGPDGTFRPNDTITKAEFNAALIRMVLYGYLSEDSSVWYENYNKVATDLGIINQGAGDQPVLRYEATLMLYRSYHKLFFSLQTLGYESYIIQDRGSYLGQ